MSQSVEGVGGVAGPRKVPSFDWIAEDGARKNFERRGRALQAAGPALCRDGEHGPGLVHILPNGEVRRIRAANHFAAVIVDSLDLRMMKDGKRAGDMPSASLLNAALETWSFLAAFPPVDRVARDLVYRAEFSLVEPGYDATERILFLGSTPRIADTTKTIDRFLDVMAFSTPADRANAVAAAVTALLAWHWPGAKPLILITATRSHAGKGTVADFICGGLRRASILYESQDWPMQSQLQKQLSADPEICVVEIDNVRIDSAGGRSTFIRSGFLESFVTSPDLALAAPGVSQQVRVPNHFLLVLNTNDGSASADILNRALPIHLAPTGNLFEKPSPIGNPKLEFLPAHRDQIEAELHGMIARWREQGCPLDDAVRHPMIQWARTIGGILKVNGFTDFLDNYSATRVADDPVRSALALLAAARPGEPLRPGEWAQIAKQEGLTKVLVSANDRGSDAGEARGMGVVLSRHREEEIEVLTEFERLKVRLRSWNRRWIRSEKPHVRYEFEVVKREPLPSEDEETSSDETASADSGK